MTESKHKRSMTLDERLTQALERAPEPVVPADFLARLATRLPARAAVPLAAESRIGRRAAWAALLALPAALLVLAPSVAAAHPVPAAVDLVLLAEFVALALWLRPRAHSEP